MRDEIIKVYDVEKNLPMHGEIVHCIGFTPSCVYYTDHRKGFWFIDGTGEKASGVKEWYHHLM